MSAAAIIWIIYMAMALGFSFAEHGQAKMKTENAWWAIIAIAVHVALLWWGGFFS